jgi:hypothetical protein
MRALALAALLSGCVIHYTPGSLEDIQERCAGEARAEYYVGHKSVDEAMSVYRSCLRREGLS